MLLHNTVAADQDFIYYDVGTWEHKFPERPNQKNGAKVTAETQFPEFQGTENIISRAFVDLYNQANRDYWQFLQF